MSYSVGQVAELAGVTVRTLHHYGQIGLLEPRDRTSAGYRRYSDADLDRLRHIRSTGNSGSPSTTSRPSWPTPARAPAPTCDGSVSS